MCDAGNATPTTDSSELPPLRDEYKQPYSPFGNANTSPICLQQHQQQQQQQQQQIQQQIQQQQQQWIQAQRQQQWIAWHQQQGNMQATSMNTSARLPHLPTGSASSASSSQKSIQSQSRPNVKRKRQATTMPPISKSSEGGVAASAAAAASTASSAAASSTPVPPVKSSNSTSTSASSILKGSYPFEWRNAIDTDMPLNFQFTPTNVYHPSVWPYLKDEQRLLNSPAAVASSSHASSSNPLIIDPAIEPQSSNWGCSCPDGRCQPATCSCAQHTRHQYTRQSRLVNTSQPHSLCECWIYCSCHRDAHYAKLISPSPAASGVPSSSSIPATSTSIDSRPISRYLDEDVSALSILGTDVISLARSEGSTRILMQTPFEHHPPDDDEDLTPQDRLGSSASPPPPTSNYTIAGSRSRCFNRVVQLGPIGTGIKLVVFKTRLKGFGLKTLTRIPRYTYVCEYIGEVLHEHVSEARGIIYSDRCSSNYLFSPEVVAPQQTTVAHGGTIIDADAERPYDVDIEPFSIDSQRVGHIARFINHSCTPNLMAANVFIQHRRDSRMPRVAFFSTQVIEAGSELTFSYGYKEKMEQEFICQCQNCILQRIEGGKLERQQQKRQKTEMQKKPPVVVVEAKSSPEESPTASDPLAAIPTQFFVLDSSIPLPTSQQLSDPSSIYYETGFYPSHSRCSLQHTMRDSDALTSDVDYRAALDSLIGVGSMIPTESTCCYHHIHPSRISLACFVLQQEFGCAVEWHERQIECMRRIKAEAYDRPPSNEFADDMSLEEMPTSDVRPPSRQYRCHPCQQTFPSRLLLCSHRSAHVNQYQCSHCHEIFTSQIVLDEHRESSNSDTNSEAEFHRRHFSNHNHFSMDESIDMPLTNTLRRLTRSSGVNATTPNSPTIFPTVALPPPTHSAIPVSNHLSHPAPNSPLITASAASAPPAYSTLSVYLTPPQPSPRAPTPLFPSLLVADSMSNPSVSSSTSGSSSPTILPSLVFLHKSKPLRMVELPSSYSLVSSSRRCVFAVDVSRLLKLSSVLHQAFMKQNRTNPLYVVSPTHIHISSQTHLSIIASQGGLVYFFTAEGVQHYCNVHQAEVRQQAGLAQWIEKVFLPALNPALTSYSNESSRSHTPTPIRVKSEPGAPSTSFVSLLSPSSPTAAAASSSSTNQIPAQSNVLRYVRTNGPASLSTHTHKREQEDEEGDEEEDQEEEDDQQTQRTQEHSVIDLTD